VINVSTVTTGSLPSPRLVELFYSAGCLCRDIIKLTTSAVAVRLSVQLNTLDRQHSNKYRPVVRISLGTDGLEAVHDITAVCSLSG